MPEAIDDLRLLIRSRHPLITIETDEEIRAVERVLEASRSLSLPVYLWDMVEGLRPTPPANPRSQPDSAKPAQVLAHIASDEWAAVFVLRDMCAHLKDAALQRLLRGFATKARQHRRTIVLVDTATELPPGLDRLAVPYRIPLPDEAELERIVRTTFAELSRYMEIRSELTASQLQQLLRTMRGLTAYEARLAISRVVLDDDCLSADDIARLLEVKREMVHEGGMLEYIEPDVGLDAIGGLTNLKHWLAKRQGALTPKAAEFGLEPPRGILLLGVQGCGKSAACKAVATAWQMPLLRLDPGRFYDKFIGESERNLRKAIQQAESMAPVVLWIDEIEKAFASANADAADGGLSKRMFGTLLNWLSDHRSPIFCAATANDISALPPELVRKGRFDEVFFVDLPNHEVREQVFAIHLEKRNRDPNTFDLGELAGASEGYSGSEIEQVIVGALYTAFGAQRELVQSDLLAEIDETRPLSVTMAERVASLRAWAANRCVPAD
jgi:ATP-dependent 26S proteasome regulatory subunit